jgi:hypothetical protein
MLITGKLASEYFALWRAKFSNWDLRSAGIGQIVFFFSALSLRETLLLEQSKRH